MMVRPSGEERRQFPIGDVKLESWEKRPPENQSKDDMVTLSKSQLQQIWSAINLPNAYEDVKENTASENNHKSNGATELKENNSFSNTSQGYNQVQAPCPLDVLVPCQASISWSASQADLSPNKLSPLSKVEQKRQQWEKEKAEMIDWNPWGKPGAGAPVKKMQVVAPITPRRNNQLLMVQTSGAVPYLNSVPTSIPSCLPSPNPNRILPISMDPSSFPPNKPFPNYSYVTQPVKPVPPVFKSSIAFGNVENESASGEYFKRQQWLRELEYQHEEQRRFQEHMSQAAVPDWVNNCKDTESISASVDGYMQSYGNDLQKRNYTRGQGFQLDPESAAEAEERRIKAQKYQQDIRLQMEEKQRKVEAERERKKVEEEEEERRLAAERAQIKAEYEQEQRRLKQKAEIEEKKHQAMVTAMQQAQAEAEMERKSRKIHRLLPLVSESQSAIPDPTSSTVEENQATVLESPSKDTHRSPERTLEGQKNQAIVQPHINQAEDTHSDTQSESTSSGKKDLGIQTTPVSLSNANRYTGYVVDRVLTPSMYRVRARRGHGRDFGTQTDIHYGKFIVDDAESTESNTSSFHSPVGKRLTTRVQYTKPYKVQRRPNDMIIQTSNLERPKWGANQPSKSYIRMTERDPHFTKRKKMQELRKQHWEREMAAQQVIRNARKTVGVSASYPSLRGRRALSSSDCTMGYSSSEFETRSCSQFRSNSTPRFHQHPSGFRSDCGSTDNIAYLSHHHNSNATYRLNNHHNNHHNSNSTFHRTNMDSHSSDNLPSIIGGSEPTPSRQWHDTTYSIPDLHSYSGSLPPMRRKWHSQETFFSHNENAPLAHARTHFEPFRFEQVQSTRRKWSDQESFDLDSVVRSQVEERGRGSSAESSEKSEAASLSSAGSSRGKSSANQNPLIRPEVVTGKPTPRQDRILQNLSSLRQGLLKKQQELESLIRRPPHYLS